LPSATGDEDTLTSLAGRLARLDREVGERERREIEEAAEGKPLREIANALLDAVDPDKQREKAQELFSTDRPTPAQIGEASAQLLAEACAPFDKPRLRNALVEIKSRIEQTIDVVSQDAVIMAGFDTQAAEKARTIVDTFGRFIEENRDELTALQIIYDKPYGRRFLTYAEIKELAEAIAKPPYKLTPELVWQAYDKLDRSKVRGAGPQKLLTDIVSLIRFAIGESDVLEPFSSTVNARFDRWLSQQEMVGRRFTPGQRAWLEMIRDHIAASASVAVEDFDYAPFSQRGGRLKAYEVFDEVERLLEELNEVLAV